MIDITDKSNCCGCGACAQKCLKRCIKMTQDEEGFLYPVVDADKCIDCGLCERVCPVINQSQQVNTGVPKAYAAFSKNEAELLQSSSGGVFSLFARRVIQNNGTVFGAAYTDNFEVKHIAITDVNELHRLRGSKYIQSSIEDSYEQAEKLLKSKKQVLFSGTPCQIEGLINYLGKAYDNLLTVDIICTGAPSPGLWKEYIAYRTRKDKAQIKEINLRYKKYGWQEYIVLFDYMGDKQYTKTRFEDPFMRAFRSAYSLRPSCYDCQFKSQNRRADITLADFWGIETVMPEMNHHTGTSMLFVHTEKGARAYKQIADSICSREVDKNTAVSCNPMMIRSVEEPHLRSDFFQCSNNHSFVKAVNKYCKIPVKQKMRFTINNVWHYLKER